MAAASACFGSSSLSWVAASSSSSSCGLRFTRCAKISFAKGLFEGHQPGFHQVTNAKEVEKSSGYVFRVPKAKIKDPMRQITVFANLEDLSSNNELISDSSEQDKQLHDDKELSPESSLLSFQRTSGKPGFISFHGQPSEGMGEVLETATIKQSSLFWFIGPTVLVASFIFPSLYLRKILSSVFEDSLLTDFMILFFTEALFYCGVAIFLLLVDHLLKPLESMMSPKRSQPRTTQLVHHISSVVALVSLIIPMVTMGLVWPWTGPAAAATLAPYLVGIVVQFAFEQYAKYVKSPSWSVIPVTFQVYRLHQLNRAAQLVTALSFTVRGAETTAHNLAINNSLRTLVSVVQFLGVMCMWSLSSFVMRFLPLAAVEES